VGDRACQRHLQRAHRGGDPSNFDSVYNITAEGLTVVTGTPNTTTRWFDGTQNVTVSDGRLTIANGAGSSNNKINFIDITGSATNLAPGRPIVDNGHNQTFVATNANDGNVTTYWEGLLGYPNLLTVDLGPAVTVSVVRIKLNPAWPGRTQTFSVLGSTDNVSYTTIVVSTSYNFTPATANTVTIPFSPISRRYIRLSFTGNTGAPSGQVAEFEVYP